MAPATTEGPAPIVVAAPIVPPTTTLAPAKTGTPAVVAAPTFVEAVSAVPTIVSLGARLPQDPDEEGDALHCVGQRRERNCYFNAQAVVCVLVP